MDERCVKELRWKEGRKEGRKGRKEGRKEGRKGRKEEKTIKSKIK